MSTIPRQEEHRQADGSGGPSEIMVVGWDALVGGLDPTAGPSASGYRPPAGDRWAVLAGLSLHYLVVVELAPDSTIDPVALLAGGASAVVTLGCPPDDLVAARAAVRSGGSYLSPRVFGGGAAAMSARRGEGVLGPREVETLRCLVDGLTHRQVARRLGVTEQTVSTYAKRLRRKLGAGNAAELTQRAIELGYIAANN